MNHYHTGHHQEDRQHIWFSLAITFVDAVLRNHQKLKNEIRWFLLIDKYKIVPIINLP